MYVCIELNSVVISEERRGQGEGGKVESHSDSATYVSRGKELIIAFTERIDGGAAARLPARSRGGGK